MTRRILFALAVGLLPACTVQVTDEPTEGDACIDKALVVCAALDGCETVPNLYPCVDNYYEGCCETVDCHAPRRQTDMQHERCLGQLSDVCESNETWLCHE